MDEKDDAGVVAELMVSLVVSLVAALVVDKEVNGQYVVVIVTIEVLQVPKSQDVVVKVVTWVVSDEEVEDVGPVIEEGNVVTIGDVVKTEGFDANDVSDGAEETETVVTDVLGVTRVELSKDVAELDTSLDVESDAEVDKVGLDIVVADVFEVKDVDESVNGQ